jgi:hypothetical protein
VLLTSSLQSGYLNISDKSETAPLIAKKDKDSFLTSRTESKRTAATLDFDIGIAEGGARTHDLEVDLFAVIRATRSTN